MGEIHLARDGELKREVAVKMGTVSEGAVDSRFTKEARVLANLAHPNILPLYNLGVDSAVRPLAPPAPTARIMAAWGIAPGVLAPHPKP
jgi:serine/threonine protein kinase